MSVTDDLDAWADEIATAVGIPYTRDPAMIYPPCLFVSLPAGAGLTLTGYALDVPVSLVAPGVGKESGDVLLDYLPGFLAALKPYTGQAASATQLVVGKVTFDTYQSTARLIIT